MNRLIALARPLLTTLLALVLGLQLAWWFWHFVKPTSPPPMSVAGDASSGRAVDMAPLLRLLGERAGTPVAAPSAATSIRLKGVATGREAPYAFAILSVDGKDRYVALDADVSPGVRLVEIFADRVTLDRNGARESLGLEARASGSATQAVAAAPIRPFALNIKKDTSGATTFSRSELNTTLQDARAFASLGRLVPNPPGGMRVAEAPSGTLIQKLGLQPGDVLRFINGQSINNDGDLARLYQQFAQVVNIRVEGTRGGQPLMLNFSVTE